MGYAVNASTCHTYTNAQTVLYWYNVMYCTQQTPYHAFPQFNESMQHMQRTTLRPMASAFVPVPALSRASEVMQHAPLWYAYETETQAAVQSHNQRNEALCLCTQHNYEVVWPAEICLATCTSCTLYVLNPP